MDNETSKKLDPHPKLNHEPKVFDLWEKLNGDLDDLKKIELPMIDYFDDCDSCGS